MTKLSPKTDEIVLTVTLDQYHVKWVEEDAVGDLTVSIDSCPLTKFRTIESRVLAEIRRLGGKNPRLAEFPQYVGTEEITYRMTLEEFKEYAHVC